MPDAFSTAVTGYRCPIFGSNTYFYPGPGTEAREGILVDPGLDCEGIEATLAANSLTPRLIVCTHAHFDHLGSAAFFQQRFGVEVLLHHADAPLMRRANFLLMAFHLPQRIALPEPKYLEGEGGSWEQGGQRLSWRHTPGHTPGSCIFEVSPAGSGVAMPGVAPGTAGASGADTAAPRDPVAERVQGAFPIPCGAITWFTGDTLFSRGVGLSRLPGEDRGQLRSSLGKLVDELVSGTMVLPGHGPPSDAAAVVRENHALRQFLADGSALAAVAP